MEIEEWERYQPCENSARCRDSNADYEWEELLRPPYSLNSCQEVDCLNAGFHKSFLQEPVLHQREE